MAPHPYSLNPLNSRPDLHRALLSLLDPLHPFTSPTGSLVRLGSTGTHYDELAAQLEGFSRPLWGLASLLAGGGDYPGKERWIRGFKSGTDPKSSEYWGDVRDRDQRMVEMAPIGFALAVAGKTFWGGLSVEEKGRVAEWLGSVNSKEMPNTNWLWFRVFANLGLRSVGAPFSADRLKADLEHLDTFYLSAGWSRDGPEGVRQLDYYSGPFAIQFAQLVYSKLAADTDPDRAEEYRERAKMYVLDYVHYFAPDGAPIPFGRSTTYRLCLSSLFSALAFASVLPAPLTWGHIKGLLLRNLRWWSTQDIFTPSGTFSLGYSYPNQFFTENYNSPQSPYWACKSFIALAVPESHPFWTAKELPYPTELLPEVRALEHPGHIMVRRGGHTFLLSSGQACSYPLKATQAKYGKFAYSATFGFCVPTGSYGLNEAAPDSMLALSVDGGETWKTRRLAPEARIITLSGGAVLESKWFPWRGVEIHTWLIPPSTAAENWHLRIHHITSDASFSDEAFMTAEGAFAIYSMGRDRRHLPRVSNSEDVVEGRFENESGEAWTVSKQGAVGILDLGSSGARRGEVLDVDANANLIHPRTVMPMLRGTVKNGEDIWYVTAVFALPAKEGVKHGETWREQWRKLPVVPQELVALMKG
ncbi:hypothetical protein RUND412_006030 [Rhizina undulata]